MAIFVVLFHRSHESSATPIFEALGAVAAGRVGEVLAETPTFSPDVCAGHVAEIASRRGWPCVTDRGPVLRAIVPGLEIEPLP